LYQYNSYSSKKVKKEANGIRRGLTRLKKKTICFLFCQDIQKHFDEESCPEGYEIISVSIFLIDVLIVGKLSLCYIELRHFLLHITFRELVKTVKTILFSVAV